MTTTFLETAWPSTNARFSYLSLVGVFLLVTVGLVLTWVKYAPLAKMVARATTTSEKNKIPPSTLYVEPVPDTFKWYDEKPMRSYPFKDKEYKLTMGIRSLDFSEWLLIEDTYLDRIAEKQKIVTNNHPAYPSDKDLKASTVFSSPEGEPALRELYDMVINYMCQKYPMYFVSNTDGSILNKITGESVPSTATDVEDPETLLLTLSRTIEEDFIILLKDETKKDEEYGLEYYFKAGVFAFAAGFDPKDKFNQPLTSIHGPIPGYEQKLKTSMNRFFDRIQPGNFVTRSNFSIQTHKKLFVDDENKGYHLTEEELNKVIPFESLDFDSQVNYRSERQTLTKLPHTGAVLFTIRTYLHPLSKFKNDIETAQVLKGAINKFPPDLARYKNIVQPRPAVTRYFDELKAELAGAPV